ncbi:MAG: phospholipid-binding protein MlaC [Alphaproteobacteria bacterium]
MTGRHIYLKFLLIVTLIGFAAGAKAETPKAQLEETMERVMALTQTFRSEQDFTDNKDRLKQIILPRFDFAEMARRSLGNHWSALAGREKEFVAAFLQFAEASYMNALGSYRGEKMTYGREQVDENFAEVDTQVLGRGESAPVTYKLHLVGGNWKVYDVIIDNVSVVSNFRSQFGRILENASIDELMRRLREKGAQG